MNREQGRHDAATRCAVAALALAAVAITACGSATAGRADPPGVAARRAGPPRELSTAQAARVLTAFDRADSAVSVAGNIAALSGEEAPPALYDSIAAIHRAKFGGSKQAAYSHANPVFAIPAGHPGCFLAAATLRTVGDEVPQYDVSEFSRTAAGSWKLSFHVLIQQSTETELAGIDARPAPMTTAVIGGHRRRALAAQLFTRTTGPPHPNLSLVASSSALDQGLAVGWTYYQQQLHAQQMTVRRSMNGARWSTCAGQADGSAVAFVTIDSTDTVRRTPRGPRDARLTVQDTDMVGLGRDSGISGRVIKVRRIDEFLLLVPAAARTPATVLGLVDAPVSVTASGR